MIKKKYVEVKEKEQCMQFWRLYENILLKPGTFRRQINKINVAEMNLLRSLKITKIDP